MSLADIENLTPIDIIDNLKQLRKSDLVGESFFKQYLDNIFYLLKAKSLVFLEFKHENWCILDTKEISQDDLKVLGPNITSLASNGLKNGFAYEQLYLKINNITKAISIAFKIQSESADENKVVYFIYEYVDKNDLNNLILKTQLINDIPANLNVTSKTNSEQIDGHLKYILNLNTELISIKEFKLASNTIVNDIASKFDFDKVSLGFIDNKKVSVVSISHTGDFEKNNTLYEKTIGLYEESVFQDEDVVMLDLSEPYYIIDEHKSFYIDNNLKTLITFPIRYDDKVIGVLQAYSKSKTMSEKDIVFLRLTVNKIAPTLYNIYKNDVSVLEYLNLKLKDSFSNFITPENALMKFSVIFSSILFLYVMFFSWNYEISATSILSTNDKASISTPFDGIINNIFVKVGDDIRKGQNLFALEIQELKLKELESKADIIRYQKEQEHFMSQRKLADMEISKAKVLQAKSKLKRIQYNIDNSIIKSTISGTVIQGDEEKLLGMPINKGDTVFYISSSTNLFLEIKVEEDDIYHINEGQKGKMILLSNPLEEYGFTVKKIIPKAEVDSTNGNIFMVYGLLDEQSKELWHPGMSGIVKIDTGPKNILWILTHNLSDFLRLYFW